MIKKEYTLCYNSMLVDVGQYQISKDVLITINSSNKRNKTNITFCHLITVVFMILDLK